MEMYQILSFFQASGMSAPVGLRKAVVGWGEAGQHLARLGFMVLGGRCPGLLPPSLC